MVAGGFTTIHRSDNEPWHSGHRNPSTKNRKIDAIKLYRTHTGQGLKESKEAVERAMVTGTVEGTTVIPTTAETPGEAPDWRTLVWQAIRAGNKIEAIVLYRRNTGCGLHGAKEAVEQAEVRGEMG